MIEDTDSGLPSPYEFGASSGAYDPELYPEVDALLRSVADARDAARFPVCFDMPHLKNGCDYTGNHHTCFTLS
jgi:hypothetical protein